MVMDTTHTKDQLVERLRKRFQQYKNRHDDALQRYVNNMPVQQARDRNTDEMIIERINAQQPLQKNKQNKQIDAIRRYSNQSTEQTNNTSSLNGVFNNNNDIIQVSQKRSYAAFNPGNATNEDTLQKMSRLSSNGSKQYANIQNNVTYNVPNVNPFQQTNGPSKPLTSSSSNMLLSNIQTSSSNAMNDGLKHVKNDLNTLNVKTETPLTNSCSVSSNSSKFLSETTNESANDFSQFNTDPLAGLAEYKLYGEVTKNSNCNLKKKDNVENQSSVKHDLKAGVKLTSEKLSTSQNTTQTTQQNWTNSLPDPTLNSIQNSSVNVSKMQNPLEHLGSMVPRQTTHNAIEIGNQQQPLQQQQLNQKRPINLNTMISSSLNQQMSKNLTYAKSNVMPSNNSVSSPHSMIQSPDNSLHSPLNNLQQSSMNTLSPSMTTTNMPSMQGNMPPTLPRLSPMPTMRQHLAEHINKHQQPNLPNIPNMSNPYISNPAGPTAKEKLQERLLKNREQQSHMHIQNQMAKNQFISTQQHMMSPINNPMAQMNPFQFPSDFQTYNQQAMNMQQQQQQQQNNMGFYPNHYQMEQNQAGQMFSNTAPAGYSQQNRNAGIFRNMMRDRQQQMSEMYNPSLGNIRSTMEQHAMYNIVNKAPPQYPSQGMNNLEQQLMMSNGAMQTATRLSHFTQPNTGTMGMSGPHGMNPGQLRMRAPVNTMTRYQTPPALSRPMTMPVNDNMNIVDNSQFSNFNMQQHNQGSMMGLNQTNQVYTSNYANDLMLLQKRRLAQRHILNMQRQNQQSTMLQAQNFNSVMHNPNQNLMGDGPKQLPDALTNMNPRVSNIPNNMNLNTTAMFSQQHQMQQNQYTDQTSMNHNGIVGQQTNNMSHGMLQQNSMVSNLPRSNTLSTTSTNASIVAYKQTTINSDSIKNNYSNIESQSHGNVNLNAMAGGNKTQSTSDADLDSLLDNPPETFDLLEMFR